MGIFVSLMDFFDQSKREAQIYLWNFLSHLWTFLTKPKREAQTSIINKLNIQNATKKTLGL